MENAVMMFGAFTLAAAVLALFAFLGRRKDRQSRNRAA
jgi:hypothetical protein